MVQDDNEFMIAGPQMGMGGSPMMHSPNAHPNPQLMNNPMMMNGPRVSGPMGGQMGSHMIPGTHNIAGQFMHFYSWITTFNFIHCYFSTYLCHTY